MPDSTPSIGQLWHQADGDPEDAVARAKREETKRAQGKTLAAKQEAYSAAREQGLPPDKAIEAAGAARGPSTLQRYERAWRLAREAAEAGERS